MPKRLDADAERKRPMFSVSIEESIFNKFQLKVANENKSVSEKVREWIIQFLKGDKNDKK